MKTQITKDLQDLKINTEVYVKQILIMNEGNNDEESYRKLVNEIVQELFTATRRHLAAYTKDGELLLSTKQELFLSEKKELDFLNAAANKTSYTMKYSEKDQLEVVFSMPILIEKKEIGIIRYYLNYTELRRQGNETQNMVFNVIVIIYGFSFIAVVFVLTRFIRTIRKLTQTSNHVTQSLNNYTLNQEFVSITWPESKRNDEIGELAQNYSIMFDTIGNQFQKMKEDKDSILKLMKSKQEFYNNVTHELKTPLTTISGYAQLIQANGIRDGELLKKGTTHILQESTRLHQMVMELIEMSDTTMKSEFKVMLLDDIIQSVAEAMEIKAKRYKNTIRMNVERGLHIACQEERIRQVFINLIDNAIKYGMPKEDIIIDGYHKDDYVWIMIKNKGKGIKEEHLTHIFEPFYRVDKEYAREQGSSGLGLSICQKILIDHNATIQVSSKENQDTVLTLRFLFCENTKGHGMENEK